MKIFIFIDARHRVKCAKSHVVYNCSVYNTTVSEGFYMTTMRECVDHLSKEIGARPTGTDEEQDAALYIQDIFNQETNFQTELQEFDAVKSPALYRCILAAISLICAILVFITSAFAIPGFILATAACALYFLDKFGIFTLGKYIGKVPSQNVVAKHVPAGTGTSRKRKIVILTNYDSDKMRTELASGLFPILGYLKIFSLACLALIAISCLLAIFAGNGAFIKVLLVIGIVGSLLPILKFVSEKAAKYNDGANNNAASVAVMLDVAKRISTGVYMPGGDTPVIHGRRAAEAASVIPANTQVEWQAGPEDEAAASAVAAMLFSNRHAEEPEPEPISEEPSPAESFDSPTMPGINENYAESIEAEAEEAASDTPSDMPGIIENDDPSVPSWFKSGLQKAGNKGNTGLANVKRSRFDNAFENAVQRNEPVEEPKDTSDLQAKLDAIHSQIEANSFAATSGAQNDASVAKNVLDNEENQALPTKENTPSSIMPGTDENEQQNGTGAGETDSDIPELMPLEPEYGLEVEEYKKLDLSKTAPMEPVVVDNRTDAGAAPVTQPAPRRDIKLPSLTGALEAQKLREELGQKSQMEQQAADERMSKISNLGAQLPSMTQMAAPVTTDDNQFVSNAGAFGVGDATGTFAPITDEDLLAANAGEDMYVYDADDYSYQEATTETGAVAGPGYVDIPESHAESIFGKLFHRKKNKDDGRSFSDSIGVDESWEARQVGKDRGDWSSFLDEDEWNGGAVYVGEDDDDQVYDDSGLDVMNTPAPTYYDDFASPFSTPAIDENVYSQDAYVDENAQAREEIYQFSTNDVSSEVWCVALGSEACNHSGLEQFIEANRDALKGAVIICADAMGAGDLALLDKEGIIKPAKVSTRMKRQARNAAANCGLSLASKEMTWDDSTAAKVGAQGFNVLHVSGMEGDKPALLAQTDDVSENVSNETMQNSANFLMELVRAL